MDVQIKAVFRTGGRNGHRLHCACRCVLRALRLGAKLRGRVRPERATTAGRGSVRQELLGLCLRSDERA